ncbi:MAG: hypothetical protein ACE5GE_13770, partial [Phycisphaerae bacterium]
MAASDDNLPTVQATDAQIDRMLAEGADAPTICAEVAQSLQDDDRVAGAAVDPDIDAVWVDFVDGESQVFQIIDDTADSEGLIKDDTFALIKSVQNRNRNRPTPPVTQPRQFNPPNPADLIHLPAKDKALLANALSPFHANWDVTDTTEKLFAMLFDLGYEGKRVPLTLDLVETFGDYGVIVLETHGTWRDPIYPADQVQLPAGILDDDDNSTSPTNDNCGGTGARHVLLTTTRVTGANLAPRGGEIFCGQLVIWNVHLRQKNGKVTKQAN